MAAIEQLLGRFLPTRTLSRAADRAASQAPAMAGDRLRLAAKALAPLPVSVPKNAAGKALDNQDVAAAIASVKDHRMNWNPFHDLANLLWFAKQERRGGPWDYKNLAINKPGVKGNIKPGTTDATAVAGQDYGNFMYGVVGQAMGIPKWLLLKAAGLESIKDGETKFNAEYARTNLDIPRDQQVIKKGFSYFDANKPAIDQAVAS